MARWWRVGLGLAFLAFAGCTGSSSEGATTTTVPSTESTDPQTNEADSTEPDTRSNDEILALLPSSFGGGAEADPAGCDTPGFEPEEPYVGPAATSQAAGSLLDLCIAGFEAGIIEVTIEADNGVVHDFKIDHRPDNSAPGTITRLPATDAIASRPTLLIDDQLPPGAYSILSRQNALAGFTTFDIIVGEEARGVASTHSLRLGDEVSFSFSGLAPGGRVPLGIYVATGETFSSDSCDACDEFVPTAPTLQQVVTASDSGTYIASLTITPEVAANGSTFCAISLGQVTEGVVRDCSPGTGTWFEIN